MPTDGIPPEGAPPPKLPLTPAEMRAYIIERLTGDTGEPEQVLRAARALGNRARGLFATGLNALLAAPLAVELAAVEIARTADLRALADRGDLVVVAPGANASDAAMLALDSGALALIVSAMFGGDPAQPLAPISREPSPIETEVAAAALLPLAEALNAGGAPDADLSLGLPLPVIMAPGDAKKFVPRDGPAAKLVFRLSAGANSGEIAVLVIQRLLRGTRGADAAAGGEWGPRISGEIMRSTVAVEAVMPLARLTLGALSGFGVGDTLALDAGSTEDARLIVRGKTVFVCEFGRLGSHYTVRVKEPFDAAQDFMDGLLPH